jgi:hypothetical protein
MAYRNASIARKNKTYLYNAKLSRTILCSKYAETWLNIIFINTLTFHLAGLEETPMTNNETGSKTVFYYNPLSCGYVRNQLFYAIKKLNKF